MTREEEEKLANESRLDAEWESEKWDAIDSCVCEECDPTPKYWDQLIREMVPVRPIIKITCERKNYGHYRPGSQWGNGKGGL